ncbi:MAG: trans-aconitate 2-methyltransferase [Gemmatimonadales bacterium]
MSRDIWNPRQYRAYSSERARPFFELLARVDVEAPAYVVDLGCGPGERTADLATRWPGAVIEGVDSSGQMISEARHMLRQPPGTDTHTPAHPNAEDAPGAAQGGGVLRFSVGDLAEWAPDRAVDVIFSNAALQWVPEHRRLLSRWVEALAPGGRLAFGMPGNFEGPSHVLLRELCESPRWGDRLGAVNRHNVVGDPADYFELLSDLGCDVDAWETTYLQVLHGLDPVLAWMKGTALRPALDVLTDEGEREEFLGELAVLLRQAYPPGRHGTVFPFRRVFVVARPKASPPRSS